MEYLLGIILTGGFFIFTRLLRKFWKWIIKQAGEEILNPKHRKNGKENHH
jgi:hypothetical protein